MKKKKIGAFLLAAALALTSIPVGSLTVRAQEKEAANISSSEQAETTDGEMAETSSVSDFIDMTKEDDYREQVDIVKHKVSFSVIQYRKHGDKASHLKETSELCKKHGLKDVSFVFEQKTDKFEQKKGYDAYQMFYEASTKSSNVWKIVDSMNKSDDVVYAEPDYVWDKAADMEASSEEMSKETHFDNMEISQVWKNLKANSVHPGEGTVVAVIDTGVDYNHKDLKDNMWVNKGEIPGNGIDDDGNGYVDDVYGINLIDNSNNPMDDNGHGTHVAGIVAMSPGNGGGVGIAYASKIMSIKAGQSNGSFASTDIAKAVKYAADNGADVINMSFGGTGKSYLVETALQDAFSSCVLVAAAGNDGLPTTDAREYTVKEDVYPAGYDYVIGVMACDNNNQLADFSNWDYKSGANCEYEIVAPGVNIYSTIPNNKYARWSGTSMAAPVVSAAAAIIRSKNTDKNQYSSRYIMGQLVNATESRVNYEGSLGDKHTYPRLNIRQSLQLTPKPELCFKDIQIFDGKDIDENNNGDGIIQAGETIDIGFKVWNSWGSANNVKVTADAPSQGGVSNPYIEFIKDNVELDDVGTFSSVNNGYVYDDGLATGVTKPIRVKIKDSAPNDLAVDINLSGSCNNGMDSSDKASYTCKDKYTMKIENGEILRGKITEDKVLTADKNWIVESSVLIPEGVTVTIEPGTKVQFWGNGEAEPGSDVYIDVKGKLLSNGTENTPVEMFLGKHNSDRGILIYGDNVTDDDDSKSYVELNYTNIENPYEHMHSDEFKKEFSVTKVDHCKFYQSTDEGYQWNDEHDLYYYGHVKAREIENTIFQKLTNQNNVIWPSETIIAHKMNNCIFDGCSTLFGMINCKNTVFLNNSSTYKKTSYNNMMINGYKNNISNCAILNSTLLKTTDKIMAIVAAEGEKEYDLTGNFWGTMNETLVAKQYVDSYDNVNLSTIKSVPFLTQESSELSTIYPFVSDLYLTDKDGNKITSISGGQEAEIHVLFNKDMSDSVQPTVTYGGAEPYTDYAVYGSWKNAKEWVGKLKPSAFIDAGTMYPRVKGAVAADDAWLVTGTDVGRFSFDIVNSSVQSMALQGSGDSGKNVLNWTQDDYDTLAGYNLYRSKSYDKKVDVKTQDFEKINTSVIPDNPDETITEYEDADVEQGTDYYYYFTVVDTAFNESEPSNVVKCTPKDEEAPVIKHTPVTVGTQGESIDINAEITDNVKVDSAKLYYKMDTASDWNCVDMRNTTGNKYKGVIAPYNVSEGKLKYYITASDGTNTVDLTSGSTIYEIDVKSEHNWDDGTVIEKATCIDKGKVKYVCQDCQAEKIEETDALGHDYATEWSTDKEATCTTVGSKSHHCNRCSSKTDVTEIPMKEHVYDGGVVTKANSCTESGTKLFTCINCSATYEQEIPAKNHNYVKKTVAPDCTNKGYDLFTCSNCNDSYKANFTDAEGHIYVTKAKFDVTCDEDGLTVNECIKCGKIENIVVSKTGHTFEQTKVEPTCTEQGYVLNTCTKCGGSYKSNFVAAKGHAAVEDAKVDPTCINTGLTAGSHCSECGEVIKAQRIINALGHDAVEDKAVAATCTTSGTTAGSHCSRCNATIVEQVTVKPLGHVFGEWRTVKSPNCVDTGSKQRICGVCGYTETEDVNAKGHDWNTEYTVDVKPTCTTEGSESIRCKNCDAVKDSKAIKALGHKYDEWKTTEKATCTENGEKEHICRRCDAVETEEVKATGHDWNTEYTVDEKATCTKAGSKSIHCKNCDATKDSETIEALGHGYGEWKTTEKATCTENGEKERTCRRCDAVETEEVKATGHEWNDSYTVDKKATCTEKGSKSIHCKNCDATKDSTDIAPSGHEKVIDNGREATCTEDGLTQGAYCRVCGEVLEKQTKINAKGHSFTEWSTVKSPNCTDKGSKQRSCKICGYTETEEMNAQGHDWKSDYTVDVEPTCTTEGSKSIHCKNCDAVKDSQSITALKHSYTEEITKAAINKDGKIVTKCKKCGEIGAESVISYPKKIALSKTSLVYNGVVQKPDSIIVDANGDIIASSNYTVTYSKGCKNVGKYTATITFKGNYEGAVSKTFTINPKGTSLKSLTAGVRKMTVKWAKQTAQTTGYQIQYSTSVKFANAKAVTVTKNTLTSKAVTKLAGKKKYYVRIRTYKKVAGKNYYSAWSKSKTVKTK